MTHDPLQKIRTILDCDPGANEEEVAAVAETLVAALKALRQAVESAHSILTKRGARGELPLTERIAAVLDERDQLCQDAHDALTEAGVPEGGAPADRIRLLSAVANESAAFFDALDDHIDELRRVTGAPRSARRADVLRLAAEMISAYQTRGMPIPAAGRPPTPRPDLKASAPLQEIRLILGCDPDEADEEVVERARAFIAFRDDVERAVNAAGFPGFMLLHELVNAVSAIAGERDRARDELAAYRARSAPPAPTPPGDGVTLTAREVAALLALTDGPAPSVKSAVRALLGVSDGH